MAQLSAAAAASGRPSASIPLLDWYHLKEYLVLVMERPFTAIDLLDYINKIRETRDMTEPEAQVTYFFPSFNHSFLLYFHPLPAFLPFLPPSILPSFFPSLLCSSFLLSLHLFFLTSFPPSSCPSFLPSSLPLSVLPSFCPSLLPSFPPSVLPFSLPPSFPISCPFEGDFTESKMVSSKVDKMNCWVLGG